MVGLSIQEVYIFNSGTTKKHIWDIRLHVYDLPMMQFSKKTQKRSGWRHIKKGYLTTEIDSIKKRIERIVKDFKNIC